MTRKEHGGGMALIELPQGKKSAASKKLCASHSPPRFREGGSGTNNLGYA